MLFIDKGSESLFLAYLYSQGMLLYIIVKGHSLPFLFCRGFRFRLSNTSCKGWQVIISAAPAYQIIIHFTSKRDGQVIISAAPACQSLIISLPKGERAMAASLKCCIPKGMPMIVMQRRRPKKACDNAIARPPSISHNIFIIT